MKWLTPFAPPILLPLALALDLLLVEVVARDVGDEVQRPAQQLLAEEVDQRPDGRLLGQLAQLVRQLVHVRGVLAARPGHEDHVALHVAGRLVVLAVRDLPREVGHEQRRVQDPADRVVERLGRREGLVAALVR